MLEKTEEIFNIRIPTLVEKNEEKNIKYRV